MIPAAGAGGDRRQEEHDLRFLFEASRRLNQVLEWERLLEEIRDLTCEALRAEACSLLLWNEEHRRLEFVLAYNRVAPDLPGTALSVGEGLAGRICETREATVVNDVGRDPRFRHAVNRQLGFTCKNLLGAPVFRGSDVIGVLELHNKKVPGGFTAEDVRLCEALVDIVAVALQNALLVSSLRREKAENEALYHSSLLLNEKIALDELLETFLDSVASVVPYQAASFYLLHASSGELEWFTHRGYAEETVEKVRLKLGQGMVGWVAKSGQPEVVEDVTREARYLEARPETRSEAVMPLINEGRVIGVLNLESDRPAAFRGGDLRLLRAFANQAAISIQRAQFYEELREKHRLESELSLARQIQTLFFPEDPKDLPGYDLAGMNLPSREVSGDFYDFIRITDGQLGLMIGDVSGKGAPAALIMATLRASLRAEIRNRYSIAEILAKTNYLLWESTEPERFATAVYGVLDQRRRVFTYSNAGHNPPLRLTADGRAEPLTDGGLILGPFQDSRYEEGFLTLAPGEILLLFTDGVVDAVDAGGGAFEQERLIEEVWTYRALPAREICRRVLERVSRHAGPGAAEDDRTVIVLKVY